MSFEILEKQKPVIKILQSQVKSETLAHTYLITGRKEWGKEVFALSFAKALQCPKNKIFKDCDCPSCHKVETDNHPDVRWLGRDEDVRSLKIDQVRDMMHWVSLKPFEGKWKVFILNDADRLTIEASNALLKTLEEPPEHTLFCLLIESKAQVLETIQSRSFEIRLLPLAEGLNENFHSNLPLGIGQTPWEDYLDEVQSMKREELKNFLGDMMQFFRDQIKDRADKESPRMLHHLKAVDAVYECKEALESNVNQKIMLSKLAVSLNNIFESSPK